jgi:hypothetical protein
MSPIEIRAAIAADPGLRALVPDWQALADALSAGRTKVGKLSAHDIRQYLMLVDLLLPIESSQQPSCVAAARALDVFPVFDLSNPLIAAKFSAVLDGLVAEDLIPDFTEINKQTILSLAVEPDPVSEYQVRAAVYADNGDMLV